MNFIMTTDVTTLSPAAAKFLSAFDGAIDDFCTKGAKVNMEQMISQSHLRGADMISIQTKIQRKVDELELVVIDADEQLIEGYSNLTKAQQREMLTMYHTIMEKVPTKTRKALGSRDGVIRVKDVVVKVTESFTTVFAICDKYKAVRVFDGNVKVTGNKVIADEIYQVRMSKNDDLLSLKDMSKSEVMTFIDSGNKTDRTPTTLSGDTIDFVLKF
jgi:hypothetical protein